MYYLQYSLLALGAILLNFNLIVSMLCIIIFLLITWKNKNLNARKAIICLIVFLVFFIRGAYIQKNNTSKLMNVENRDLVLRINDRVDINGNYLKGVGYINNERVLISYTLQNEDEKVFFKKKFYGGKVFANGSIEELKEKTNFYSFDYKKYNENRGVFKQVKLNQIKNIKSEDSIVDKIKSIRAKMSLKISNEITFDKSGYFEALILGDKNYLQREDVNAFKKLGISHLLAISGLHLGLLISIIYYILQKLNFTSNLIDNIIIIILPCYMGISGFSPSVIRAGLMIIVYLILRRKNIANIDSLLITFLIMTIINPLYIFDIGFELSFFITFSLLMSTEYIKKSKNKLQSSLKISVISFLASMPILISNFYTVPYISVLSNIILVPIFSIIIFPLVVCSYIVFLLSTTIFNILCKPLLNLVFYIFDEIQSILLRVQSIRIGNQNIYVIIAIYLIILFILICLNKNKYKVSLCGLATIVSFLAVNNTFNSSKDLFEKLEIGKSQVYYLKENGVTTLINTSNNLENFYSDFRKKDKVYDIINEYDSLLNYEGKNKIDYLILTSAKKGEIGFAETLVGKGIIKKVVILDIHKEKFNDLINLAKFKNIDVLVLKENNELIKSICYYNKIIKIKDIEIEVVD
ncbi:ComEC/Rec2 family competence protein [Gemella sanguinis]|uniref:Competence protein ComEC n=1 Tax=Gemella sanguinis TaxID=84135 RepID=A0A2N6SEB3_9BACL|nr:ComEC/Rec2 family competence protein [Gemella sanguinis]PMC52282.1 competence protein ComEC [Gemella sanguinis]